MHHCTLTGCHRKREKANVTYYPFGPPASIVYNNGLTQTRTHDSQYRLTNLTLAGGSTLDQLVYTYDSAANVDYLQDQLNSTYTRDYAYDVLNRLKWDSGVSSTNPTYTYDGNGNRLTRTAGSGFPAQTLSYVSGANKINQFNSQTVNYDGMGSVTNNANGLTFTTDAGGRMRTTVIPASTALTTLYNGLGELARVLMQAYDGCTGSWNTQYWEYYTFATDGRPLQLVQELISRVQWDWVYLDNLPVMQFQDSYDGSGTYQGTTVTYLHPDHLGTPRIGTNTSAAVSWRYRSDAFGKATISGSHTVRLRLPGQIDLGIGGINYNYFRDYDPNVGRYLESDPIGLQSGLNTYGYVNARPVTESDPLGLNPILGVGIRIVGGLIVGGGGVIALQNSGGENSERGFERPGSNVIPFPPPRLDQCEPECELRDAFLRRVANRDYTRGVVVDLFNLELHCIYQCPKGERKIVIVLPESMGRRSFGSRFPFSCPPVLPESAFP